MKMKQKYLNEGFFNIPASYEWPSTRYLPFIAEYTSRLFEHFIGVRRPAEEHVSMLFLLCLFVLFLSIHTNFTWCPYC